MKKLILLFIVTTLSNFSYAQEGSGDFEPGGGEFKMAFYGELCSNIEKEYDRAMCSQDQIAEYISLLTQPAIVQKKKLSVTLIINFNLDEYGKVVDVNIKKSSGNKELDDLCLEHIKKMPNWNPEINDNRTIPTDNLNLTFKFKYKKPTK